MAHLPIDDVTTGLGHFEPFEMFERFRRRAYGVFDGVFYAGLGRTDELDFLVNMIWNSFSPLLMGGVYLLKPSPVP